MKAGEIWVNSHDFKVKIIKVSFKKEEDETKCILDMFHFVCMPYAGVDTNKFLSLTAGIVGHLDENDYYITFDELIKKDKIKGPMCLPRKLFVKAFKKLKEV